MPVQALIKSLLSGLSSWGFPEIEISHPAGWEGSLSVVSNSLLSVLNFTFKYTKMKFKIARPHSSCENFLNEDLQSGTQGLENPPVQGHLAFRGGWSELASV
jgi:hypothetical protein